MIAEPSRAGGSARLDLELIDASGAQRTRKTSISYATGSALPDSSITHLLYALLFTDDPDGRFEAASEATRNSQAFNAFLHGQSAMRAWNLPFADSALLAATRLDPSFPQAYLALAQVRNWRDDEAANVGDFLARAQFARFSRAASDSISAH